LQPLENERAADTVLACGNAACGKTLTPWHVVLQHALQQEASALHAAGASAWHAQTRWRP